MLASFFLYRRDQMTQIQELVQRSFLLSSLLQQMRHVKVWSPKILSPSFLWAVNRLQSMGAVLYQKDSTPIKKILFFRTYCLIRWLPSSYLVKKGGKIVIKDREIRLVFIFTLS